MKRILQLIWISLFLLSVQTAYTQSGLMERSIIQNGNNDTIILSNGEKVVIGTSSDDAEQIDAEMDGLYDDDLDMGWEGDPTDLHVVSVGLRFQFINLPKGTTIDSAFIVFCSHEGKNADDIAKITIVGHASDNSETFDLTNLLTNRPSTSASVAWTVDQEWGLWEFYKTPDIKSIVQEIVNRQGWNSGNSLSIICKGENQGPSDKENAREVESYENIADPEDGGDGKNHPERSPRLMIYYTAPTLAFERSIKQNGGNDTIILSNGEKVIVGTSSDDAEQIDNEMDGLYDDDLDMGWEGDPTDLHVVTCGLRFQNITIPKDVTIDSAFVQFCSHEGKNADDSAKITIFGDANGNAPTYDLASLITDRAPTQASVQWTVAEEWGLWEFYRTPDIRSIVQDIVNRSDWNYGNALALTFKGMNQGPSDVENAREVESFENIADPEDGGDGKNHPERAPKLIVYYRAVTGIDDASVSQNRLLVYPNPVEGEYATVTLPSTLASSVHVFNLSGQKVFSVETQAGNKVNVPTGQLPAGFYLVVAKQGDKQITDKLIVR